MKTTQTETVATGKNGATNREYPKVAHAALAAAEKVIANLTEEERQNGWLEPSAWLGRDDDGEWEVRIGGTWIVGRGVQLVVSTALAVLEAIGADYRKPKTHTPRLSPHGKLVTAKEVVR